MKGTLLNAIDFNCTAFPEKSALTYLSDGEKEAISLTFAELRIHSIALARKLDSNGYRKGDRVVIALSSGVHFLVAFLACLYAGLIPVPAKSVSNKGSLLKLVSITQDSQPVAIFSERSLEDVEGIDVSLGRSLSQVQWLVEPDLEKIGMLDVLIDVTSLQPHADEIAFIQYTSGSVGYPKGVCVTHGNLAANIAVIQQASIASSDDIYLTWLPLYHDMGLIGAALFALYIGAHCVMMPPAAFAMRPVRWLKAVEKYGATITGGPNFAYRTLSAPRIVAQAHGLNLSSLRVAYCGSEPISPVSVRSFLQIYAENGLRPNAFFPCYGMAEATLMISGGPAGRPPIFFSQLRGSEAEVKEVISCGRAMCQALVIVDPVTHHPVPEGVEGEIWVHGISVASGYWNNSSATQETFRAELNTAPGVHYLRTGDLGFLSGGELFVNGRIKEIIIYNGNNYYPQDIEQCSSFLVDATQGMRAACFSSLEDGDEKVVIFQEVTKQYLRDADDVQLAELAEHIRKCVYQQFTIPIKDVVLIKQNGIPLTTSGKVCRLACKKLYAEMQHVDLMVSSV